MVLGPMGAAGTVPLMLSTLLFLLWAGSVLLGLHDPIPNRHPGRIGLALLLLATSITYVALYSGWTGPSSIAARASADRWVILLLASTGMIFVATETIKTLNDAMVLVRALLSGAVVCCLVATVQFFFHINPAEWFHNVMPGFTYNGGDTVFQNRGALLRVAGTTFTPIELAVVCCMLLPLSIWRGIYDVAGRKWLHWSGTLLLVFAIVATISRSGVLGTAVAMAVFIPFMPRRARSWVLVISPIVVAGLFLSIPGLLSTLSSALMPEEGDPSITTRTNNWPRVAAMFEHRPVLGAGPGNYTPPNALFILDNQYLNATVTMGIVGLLGMIAYFILPGIASLLAAKTATAPALKCLGGAIAAGGTVGAVCSTTFDSLSFPVFALAYPLIVGLGGALWVMTKRDSSTDIEGRF
ncbi:O-antigen ligase family protein [Pseudarthrobacter sp. LMD1-1-1.1]